MTNPMRDPEAAREAGAVAYCAGHTREHNPYKDSDMRAEWFFGYDQEHWRRDPESYYGGVGSKV